MMIGSIASRMALPALALAAAMSSFAAADAANASRPLGPKPAQRPPAANTRPVVVPPPKPSGPLAGRPVPTKPPVVVAPPSSGPLVGKPYRPHRPYGPPRPDATNKPGGVAVGTQPNPKPTPVIVPPPSSGPLAGKPTYPTHRPKPVTDASNAPGGVVVVTKPRPVKPVTCIGWC